MNRLIQRLTRRIIIGLLIAAALVVIAGVLTIASWITGSGKQTSPRAAARMKEGAEFGRTTNQQNCIDEGVKRGARLGLLDFDAQIDNEDFVTGCLQSSAITSGFCEGVPSGFRNIFVDWTKEKCKKADMVGPPCTGIYDRQIQFCEHSH
jgi:hypothetical protein